MNDLQQWLVIKKLDFTVPKTRKIIEMHCTSVLYVQGGWLVNTTRDCIDI